MVAITVFASQPAHAAANNFDETSSVATSVDMDHDMEHPSLGLLPRQTSTYSTASVVLPGTDMKQPTPLCGRWADQGTGMVELDQPLEDECEFEFDEPEVEDVPSSGSTVVHAAEQEYPAAPAPSPSFQEHPAVPTPRKAEAFEGLVLGDLPADEEEPAQQLHVAVQYRYDPYDDVTARYECYVCPCSLCAPTVAAVLRSHEVSDSASTEPAAQEFSDYQCTPPQPMAQYTQEPQQYHMPCGMANQYDASGMDAPYDDGMGMVGAVQPQYQQGYGMGQAARTDSQEYWAPSQPRPPVVAPGMEHSEPSSEFRPLQFACVPPPRLSCRDVFEEDGASYEAAHAMTYALAMRWYKRTVAGMYQFVGPEDGCPAFDAEAQSFDEWLEGCMSWWKLHFGEAQKRPAAVAAQAVSMRAAAAGARPAGGARGFQSHAAEERQPLQPARCRRY